MTSLNNIFNEIRSNYSVNESNIFTRKYLTRKKESNIETNICLDNGL